MSVELKIDKILEKVNSLETKLEVSIAYQKVQEDRISKHEGKIEILEAHRNNSVGKHTIIYLLCTSIGAGIMAIFKHF